MDRIRDAIILAGGRGTRMLPASLFVAKETLPLVDTPIINHLIWEVAKAGIEKIHLVLSKSKEEVLRRFVDHEVSQFDRMRPDLPSEALRLGIKGVEIKIHVQEKAGGVGDAIYTVKGSIEGPFLVVLGDNLLIADHVGPLHSGIEKASEASLDLVKRYEETGLPCVGVSQVMEQEICNYGAISFDGSRVATIVEKPNSGDAPSNYILSGRYILPQNTFEILEQFSVREFGENQSIALLRNLIENGGIEAVKYSEYEMYDSGNPISWMKAQIDHAFRRDDTPSEFKKWIQQRVESEDNINGD